MAMSVYVKANYIETLRSNMRRATKAQQKHSCWRYEHMACYGPQHILSVMEDNRKQDMAFKGWLKTLPKKDAPLAERFKVAQATITKIDGNESDPTLSKLSYRMVRERVGMMCPEFDQALNRAHARLTRREWVTPSFARFLPYRDSAMFHFLHVSKKDPSKVAYSADWRGLASLLVEDVTDESNKFIVTSVGKYLTKFFSDHYSELRIKEIAEKFAIDQKPVEVLFARTEDEIIEAIAEGPTESCMSNGYYNESNRKDYSWISGHIHPAAVYAGSGDFEVAYIRNSSGTITARAVCNAKAKLIARGYGDHRRLIDGLEKLGYRQESRALVGCRLRIIENQEGSGWIMPYVDAGTGSGGGSLHVVRDGRYWRCTAHDGASTYQGYEGHGVMEDGHSACCSNCGDSVDENDITTVAGGGMVCESCLDDNYTYAYGRNGYRRYYPNDEIEYCHSDGEYYATDYFPYNDVAYADCGERRGELFSCSDLVETPIGMAYEDECVRLDKDYDGCSHALKGSVYEARDGRILYKDAEDDSEDEDDIADAPFPL